jgi:hypothetical protein
VALTDGAGDVLLENDDTGALAGHAELDSTTVDATLRHERTYSQIH